MFNNRNWLVQLTDLFPGIHVTAFFWNRSILAIFKNFGVIFKQWQRRYFLFSFHCLPRRFVPLFLIIWLRGYANGVIAPRSNSWLSTTVFANTKNSPCAWILFVPILLEIAPNVLEQSVLQALLVKKSPFLVLWHSLWTLYCTINLAAALHIWCRGVEFFTCNQYLQNGLLLKSQHRIFLSLRSWTSIDPSKPSNRVVIEYWLVSMPPCIYYFLRFFSLFCGIFQRCEIRIAVVPSIRMQRREWGMGLLGNGWSLTPTSITMKYFAAQEKKLSWLSRFCSLKNHSNLDSH